MPRIPLATLWMALLGGVSLAQPYIPPGGVVNDASNAPIGLPIAAVSPGSRFAIRGFGLGPSPAVASDSFPLFTTLAGVSVTATTAAGVTYNCYPFYVSSSLVEAVLPSSVPIGQVLIRETYAGQTGNGVSINVPAQSPGIYSVSATGEGPGQISDYASASGKLISSTAAGGRPLTTASILATGLGASPWPDNLAPPQQNLPGVAVTVLVGGQLATRVIFSGLSTKHPGADQIIFQVPAGAPLGCYVPVQIAVNGLYSNFVTVALSPNGTACADPGNPASAALGHSGNLGLVGLMHSDILTGGADFIVDSGAAGGWQMPANPFAFNRVISLPPRGSCTVYLSSGEVTLASLAFALSGTTFDPGTVSVTGPNGVKMLTGNVPTILGGQDTIISPDPGPPYLGPGAYTVQSPGSATVGAYSANVAVASPITWTNRSSIQSVNRAQGVTLQWSGAGTSQVLIAGSAATSGRNSSALFLCLAPTGTTSFTVPANVLGLLPAVQVTVTPPLGQLALGTFAASTPAVLSAIGLNFGALLVTEIAGQAVLYQ